MALLEENKQHLEHFKESLVPWDILHITRLLVIVILILISVGDKRVLNWYTYVDDFAAGVVCVHLAFGLLFI